MSNGSSELQASERELLRASENASTTGMGVDVPRTRRERIGRRRLVLTAATAAAAILLVAGTVLVAWTGDDGVRGSAAPAPSSTTIPTTVPSNVVTPPNTAPGDGSTEGPLVPGGVASTPPASELVASISLFHRGAYRLYADGRLIWYDETRLPNAPVAYREQRLTPEGVERVRSVFLSSGLFDPAEPPSDIPPCTSGFQVCVRDGDRWLTEDPDPPPYGPMPYGDPLPEAVRLFDYLGTLDSSLPATEWADQQIRTYVPARIAVCLRMFAVPVGNRAEELPLDLSFLLPRFPQPAAELLAGREPSAEFERLWGRITTPPAEGSCFELTLDEARTLAAALLSSSGGGTHEYWGIVIRYDPQPDPAQPDATQPDAAYIRFVDLLPDSVPAGYFGG